MQILQTIHRLNQMAKALLEQGSEITTTQAFVLVAIGEKPGSSQTAIVEMMDSSDRSTVSDVVRRLEEKGLVKRVRGKKDTRAYVCELTEDGKKALREIKTAAAKAERALLEKVPAAKSLRIAA